MEVGLEDRGGGVGGMVGGLRGRGWRIEEQGLEVELEEREEEMAGRNSYLYFCFNIVLNIISTQCSNLR